MDDNATSNESWILSGMNHLRQPVKRRIDVTAPHRLDKCGDRVVVLILVTIVDYGFFLNAILRNLESDTYSAIIVRRRG